MDTIQMMGCPRRVCLASQWAGACRSASLLSADIFAAVARGFTFLFSLPDFILYSSFFFFNIKLIFLPSLHPTPPSSSLHPTPDYFLPLVLVLLHPHTNVVFLIQSLRQHWAYMAFWQYWAYVTLPTVKWVWAALHSKLSCHCSLQCGWTYS